MKRPFSVALAIGIAIGFALTAVVFGVGVTHIVCSEGPVMGWSGELASPLFIALAPPGGYVNASYSLKTVYNSTFWAGESGASNLPENSTWAEFEALNWTLFSEKSTTAPGWGSETPCNGDMLVPGTALWSCGGCIVTPAVPAGIGQRLVVPPQFYNGTTSAVVNATYGPSPIATIAWSENQSGIEWTAPQGVANFPGTIAPFSEYGKPLGLGITTQQSEIGFGVPIHLLSGGEETLPASFPADWPAGPPGGTTLTITMTYILPASSGQGTWAVYLPGDGGPYSPQGLLFEQTA